MPSRRRNSPPPLPQDPPLDLPSDLPRSLGLPPFRGRAPWWGADLQTIRDVLRSEPLPPERSEVLLIPLGGSDQLLARLDVPAGDRPRGLVLVLPGLGSCASARGPRRLAWALQRRGFATLRLNPRGAGEGRSLAGGSYAAACNADLLPAVRRARALAADLGERAAAGAALPLAGAGISLGGTMLLNLCREPGEEGLDALVCLSSPLDLQACTECFEQPRNAFYQRWLVRSLRQQVLADGRGLSAEERALLLGPGRPRTLRAFDERITAPRWGYASAGSYHRAASPLPALRQRALGASGGLSTLLLQAADDPWVPASPARELARLLAQRAQSGASPGLEVLLTRHGGHCGFHAVGDGSAGDRIRCSWAERLAAAWLADRLRR